MGWCYSIISFMLYWDFFIYLPFIFSVVLFQLILSCVLFYFFFIEVLKILIRRRLKQKSHYFNQAIYLCSLSILSENCDQSPEKYLHVHLTSSSILSCVTFGIVYSFKTSSFWNYSLTTIIAKTKSKKLWNIYSTHQYFIYFCDCSLVNILMFPLVSFII